MAEPEEVSSKRPVSVYRQVIPATRSKSRDPRFEAASGEFSSSHFEKQYGFIYDIKKKEIETLSTQIKKTKDDGALQDLKQAKKILNDQIQLRESSLEKQKLKSERRKKERDLVKQGKKPFFLKKATEKNMELERKYEKLKEEGKLSKYMQKKSKRKASKDKKSFYLNSELI